MKKAQPGSISHGTMRSCDLIPCFVSELEALGHEDEDGTLNLIKERIERGDEYFDSEEADFDLNEYLFDALDEHAPNGHYFGAHEGDGSDYGFWPTDQEED